MATKVLWYSESPDDPFQMRETFDAGVAKAEEMEIGFNAIVTLALRAYLDLEPVDLEAAQAKRTEIKSARMKKVRAGREESRLEEAGIAGMSQADLLARAKKLGVKVPKKAKKAAVQKLILKAIAAKEDD